MTRNTTRRRLLSGGLTALLASVAGCTGMTPFVGRRDEGTRTESVTDVDELAIEFDVGSLRIRSSDRDDVHVDYIRQSSSVTADISNLELRTERRDGRLTIISEWTGRKTIFGGRPSMDLDVEIPRSLPVTSIEGSVGSVDVAEVRGDLDVQTTTGSVTIEDLAGTVSAESTTGSIDISSPDRLGDVRASTGSVTVDVPAIDGDTELTTSTGSIDAAVAPDLDAELTVQTSTGRVDVEGIDLRNATQGRSVATGTLGEGGPSLDIETSTGSVTVTSI
ncbi:MAG: DUF4097 family beta strand repeat-containing protein [Halobacteriota archaeon]